MTPSRDGAALLAIAIAAGLAGCGAEPSAGQPSSPPAAAAVTVTVVSDASTIGAYQPAAATATSGDVVAWNFTDQNPHTVSSDSAGLFSSAPLASGHTFRFQFTHPGIYAYHCAIHPEMHGQVIVR